MFIRKIILLIMNIITKTWSSVGSNYWFKVGFRDLSTTPLRHSCKGKFIRTIKWDPYDVYSWNKTQTQSIWNDQMRPFVIFNNLCTFVLVLMYIVLWEISFAKYARSFSRFLATFQQIQYEDNRILDNLV